MIEATMFWIFAVLSVVAALGVVINRSIVYSALFLIVVFLSIAAFFVLNNADFLAVAQTIVYAVGLTIILLFGVMFTGDKLRFDRPISAGRFLAYGLVVAFTTGLLLRAGVFHFTENPISPEVIAILQSEGSTRMLGRLLFDKYLLPFELVSILLLVAMIGAIVMAKKRFTGEPPILGQGDNPGELGLDRKAGHFGGEHYGQGNAESEMAGVK
jgi:NADH:ubiquinone oxidoreductase subunit 6 (subunit J)